MIKTFNTRDHVDARKFFNEQRSTLARVVGDEILVFTPASAALNHPTGRRA